MKGLTLQKCYGGRI